MKINKIIRNIKKNYSTHEFKNINLDSKKCKKGDVFFAIKGDKFDGEEFIADAISRGAKTIISQNKTEGLKKNILYINSKDPKKLLTQCISNLFKKNQFDSVAVTGTNGKSSIANFYLQILNLCNVKCASIGTLGIDDGKKVRKLENTTVDPITLNNNLIYLKKKKINKIILEASSHGLKQKRLDNLKFSIGIFTNLTRDHFDYHNNYKDYFNSKMILFNKLMKKNAIGIYDSDTKISQKVKQILKRKRLKSIGVGFKNSNFKIKNIVNLRSKQFVIFYFKKNFYNFSTKLIGEFQIKNLLMAVAAASQFIPIDKIMKKIEKITPVNGRMEEIGLIRNNSKVFLDYAHTPEALKACILNIKNHFNLKKINLLFGCGGDRDKEKRSLMGKIANKYCNKIYLTDDNPRNEQPSSIRKQIKRKIKTYKLNEIPSRSKAISESIKLLNSGEVLVVAGKGHENFQEYKKKYFFSDKAHILQSIRKKNKNLSKDWKINLFNENLKKKKMNSLKKIKNIHINSKKISKNDVFFGLKGKKFDGSNYANESLRRGASLAIVDKKYFQNTKILRVQNSLQFFSQLSKKIRQNSNIISVGITGSAGKTSLKNLIGEILNKNISAVYSKKSFNNKFGVPLTLANIKKNNSHGVFEIGMDRKGEIRHLSNLVLPNIAVITNISYAHIENFKSLKDIALAKSEIIENIESNGAIFLNKDDKFFDFLKKKAKSHKINVFSFSKKTNADIQLLGVKRSNLNIFIRVNVFGNKKVFKIKEDNLHYMENILSGIGVLSILLSEKNISENLFYNFKIPLGRGNDIVYKTKNKRINIIDESYNSNPLSLKFAIEKFNKLKVKKNKKIILLGDMLELGKFSKNLHIQAAKDINNAKIKKVHVFGENIKNTFYKINKEKRGKILKDIKEIINLIKNEINDKEYLMIKGSNSTGLNNLLVNFKKRTTYAV